MKTSPWGRERESLSASLSLITKALWLLCPKQQIITQFQWLIASLDLSPPLLPSPPFSVQELPDIVYLHYVQVLPVTQASTFSLLSEEPYPLIGLLTFQYKHKFLSDNKNKPNIFSSQWTDVEVKMRSHVPSGVHCL